MTPPLDTIRAFLAAQSTLTLATTDEHGQPQTAPLFYFADETLNLYWLSSPTSRHSLNLAARRRAAASIYPPVWDWVAIRGLQMEGEAAAVHDLNQREAILAGYKAKFNLPTAFDAQIAASTLYGLRPAWIRWLDNSVRFGYKIEITPPQINSAPPE